MEQILLAHGGGGAEMNELINGLIFETFDNEILKRGDDGAILNLNTKDIESKLDSMQNLTQDSINKIVFSTDSFVINPLFFNGGDIGKIAVCGSVNDIAMMGAKALWLSCALIIEEGFYLENLKKILQSMKKTAQSVGVKIVCGDTKVVPKGACDGLFINTSAIGVLLGKAAQISNLKETSQDKILILLSGDIAKHGAATMAARHGMQSDLASDCAPLLEQVCALYKAKISPLAMRDATRGGLSAALNEWSKATQKAIKIYEDKITINPQVQGVCELLGFEALELANEGTFIAAIKQEQAQKALEILRSFNENAAIIGEFLPQNGKVILQNAYGSERILDEPKGELLPRIC